MTVLDQALAKLDAIRDRMDTSGPPWVLARDVEDGYEAGYEALVIAKALAAELVSRGEQIERLTRERDELQSIVGNANLWVPKRQAEARVAQLQQALVEAAIPLEALYAVNASQSRAMTPSMRTGVAVAVESIRAALVGVEAAEEADRG